MLHLDEDKRVRKRRELPVLTNYNYASTTTAYDCAYVLSTCTEACEPGGSRTITVTRQKLLGGNPCPQMAEVPDCQPGNGDCPTTTTTMTAATTTTTTSTSSSRAPSPLLSIDIPGISLSEMTDLEKDALKQGVQDLLVANCGGVLDASMIEAVSLTAISDE